MKHPPPKIPQTLAELMLVAEDFAGFSLRAGRQIPPTLLAVTKQEPLFFTPESLRDNRSKDDFADTARLVWLAYEVPAAVLILESWLKAAAEGEALDRHEVVMLMGESPGTPQRKVFKSLNNCLALTNHLPAGVRPHLPAPPCTRSLRSTASSRQVACADYLVRN